MKALRMRRYNNDIMEAVRQRMGLDEDDTSRDDDIMKMDKRDVFMEYCQWNGLLGSWYSELLKTIRNIDSVYQENRQ